MKRRRRRRKKIISYLSRILFLGMLAVLAFGMTFACLYVRDRFRQIETVSAANSVTGLTVRDNEPGSEKDEEPVGEPEEPKTGICVVLDAGHGGNDGGTYYKDVIEKDINLAVVLCLKEVLEENDVEVILTRSTDEYLSLEERTVIANKTSADLFVSIHCNYYEDAASVKGIDCYYYPNSEEGQLCAETVIDTLKENDDLVVRSAKAEDFYVLENTDMTAILVEVGFLSNATDRKNLINAKYQKMLAEELAKGILINLEETGAAND